MTMQTVATAHWRALDRAGEDKCRLSHNDAGWMLVGHARFRENGLWSAIDYVVRCGEDWLTQSADVTGTYGEAEVKLHITRDDGGWQVNGTAQPQLAQATDIDLGFTPATNLMPLRRLPEIGRLTTCAAWLRDPDGGLDLLEQSYTRERGHLVAYHAVQTGFSTHLKVDPAGFVTLYPGFWEIEHAP